MDLYIKGDIVPNGEAWIYEYIGREYTSPEKVKEIMSQCQNDEVLNVYINSGGGDVFAGAEIYTLIANYRNTKIHIVGFAASMASVIAMAGYCEISPVAQMMVHNVISSEQGNYLDMEHKAKVLKNASETIAQAYIKKSGMSKEEIQNLMDEETWLSPEKALELHLVDKIMDFDGNNQTNKIFKMSASYGSLPVEFIAKMQKKRQKAMMSLNLLKLKGNFYD